MHRGDILLMNILPRHDVCRLATAITAIAIAATNHDAPLILIPSTTNCQTSVAILPRDAMLSSCVRPSVTTSQVGVLPRQLNLGSRKQRRMITHGHWTVASPGCGARRGTKVSGCLHEATVNL